MSIILKRIFAYFIDIVLISLVVVLLTSNSYINMNYKKYKDIYEDYSRQQENYNNFYSELEKSYEDEEISENEYDMLVEFDIKEIKNLINYYEDQEINKYEYEKMIEDFNLNYSKMEIDFSYKLIKNSLVPSIINIMCILFYFVVIQFYFNGQTLGKKVMKLKIVSKNGNKLTILNYFFRCLILNQVFINTLDIIFLISLSKNNYLMCNQVIYKIAYVIEMIIIFMILFNKNNRGLHDYISNTKVIEDKKE